MTGTCVPLLVRTEKPAPRAPGSAKRIALALAFATSLGLGCATTGGGIQAGIDNYRVGRYEDAAGRFEALEGSFAEMNPKGRVRYFVYRGLSLYYLGRPDQAKSFLSQGKEAYLRGDARWLDANTVEAMNKALADIEGRASGPAAPPPTPK